MSVATIKAELATQVATLSPPYTASVVQDAIALALYNSLQKGIINGSAAASGEIGETIRISRALSAKTALTSLAVSNVATTTSITLSPGEWSIRAMIGFNLTGAMTEVQGSVSKSSATLSAADTIALPTSGEVRSMMNLTSQTLGTDQILILDIPSYEISVTVNTSLFLVASATFSTGSAFTFGYLEARRVR